MNPIQRLFRNFYKRGNEKAIVPKKDRQNSRSAGHDTAVAKREAAKLNQFAARVRDLFRGDEHKVAGAFQFLTLDKTREHFGKDWARIASKIYLVVDGTIEARLGPLDCYARIDATSYVVVFAKMEKKAAAMKAALIANEISRKLFGDDAPTFIQVGIVELGQDEATELSAMAPVAMAGALAAKASAPINIVPPQEMGDAAVSIGTGHSTNAREGKQTGKTDAIEPIDDAQTSEAGPGSEIDFSWVFDEVEIEADPEWKYIRETYEIPEDLFFAYLPAWLVRRELIAAHSCVPARVVENGRIMTGAAAIPSRRRAADNYALDMLGLMKVRRDIERSLSAGTPAVIVLPVHFETISTTRFRDSYIRRASQLTEKMRHQLVFEITGIIDDTPASTFAKVTDTLRPFCREMLARVQLNTKNFTFLHNIGVHSIGVDLGERPYSETQVFPLMQAFNDRAQKAGMNTFIHGLKTRSSVSGAVAAGFRYLDGPIIAPPIETPEQNRSWTAKDVYASLITELANSLGRGALEHAHIGQRRS